jgi:GTP-binding protein Era
MTTRCGFCAIIGEPNAGKSTLANALAGSKVSIVTHKAQTTRSRIRAIAIAGEAQIVFVDTPGIFAPKRNLDQAMVEAAWAGAAEADAILVLVDARKAFSDGTKQIVEGLKAIGRDAMLTINKIDLVEREKLLPMAAELNRLHAFAETFMISALNGSGVTDLKRAVAKRMPEGPWLYPGDQAADIQQRFLAAEITREQLFLRLHDELPYSATVETESWEERADGSVRIGQTIYVMRDGQKKIVLGNGGATIKEIGAAARKELERALERRVHLFTFVKVRENWMRDPDRLRAIGLLA